MMITSLEGLAELACVSGDAARGVLLVGASDALRLELGVPLPASDVAQRERALAAARDILDAAAFATAWTRGQALSLPQAVAVAMELHHTLATPSITAGRGSSLPNASA
jgi:hypothetical protein